ncbi:Murein DD-endopeptidase MepS/Murein LD-carboxypeptidase precursor [compost metagenome]
MSKDDLRLGDLVFFNTFGNGVSHAGIYIGDGQFAHSSSSRGVRISKLSESYYRDRYVTARRVVSDTSYRQMTGE